LYIKAREISDDWEPVDPGDLKVGEVYFDIGFVDENLLVPSVTTLVLTEVSNKDGLRVFSFEEATAHYNGVPAESAEYPVLYEYDENSITSIFDFNGFLDNMLLCAVRRGKNYGNSDS
jgi:hypothetical protein